MQTTAKKGIRDLTTVGIWKVMHRRLASFRARQKIRQSAADIVSVAVQEYLDRKEKESA